MPGTTPIRGYPYPLDPDLIDVAGDIQRLAEAIDPDVAGVINTNVSQGSQIANLTNVVTSHSAQLNDLYGRTPRVAAVHKELSFPVVAATWTNFQIGTINVPWTSICLLTVTGSVGEMLDPAKRSFLMAGMNDVMWDASKGEALCVNGASAQLTSVGTNVVGAGLHMMNAFAFTELDGRMTQAAASLVIMPVPP